jgi:transglutaminase-like putative cysteine protease
MDDRIFAPVDLDLENYRDISHMQVRARIRSMGRKLTPSDLNVPGQEFEGSVAGNLIDGVFTIEHGRYEGEDAPPFPPPWREEEDLAPYLEPEILVESDDPALIAEARSITEGAGDSWEATLRLLTWVATEIRPAVPGASARGTYDTRKGECAGHARLLTAFCRAVGIPARIVSGCMYTPIRGGSFGQHVWNEVYMGDAVGWVPLDSAVEEPGYIDSGHIRLGGLVSFRPEEMEILDYRLEAGADTLSSGGG